MKDHLYYATPSITIGKHEWRCVVIPFWLNPGTRATQYQFRSEGQDWKNHRDWPTFNINDGTYLGLPKTLRRLHDQFKDEITFYLDPAPQSDFQPQQNELALRIGGDGQ